LEESGGRAFRRVSGEAHPYFTRAQIEDGALAGRGLEIAWVKDYVGLHFLHIQGSGTLRFPDGSTASVHVAGTNGYDFQSPGRMLIRAGLSSGAYEDVQRVLRADIPRARRYLTQNPRFIFFRMDDKPTSGSAGVPLTPGRTIATDKRVYEAGAIGYVRYDAPRLASDGTLAGYASTSRFVLDQDTGNAIVGPGRADLYIGAGPLAEKLAGATNTHGELYFLIPR
ncbi:MltA domain-containing protein, partial [bacterium]|nr:MltA domain-containing protein [bacterium]